jgi:hypothetical protein
VGALSLVIDLGLGRPMEHVASRCARGMECVYPDGMARAKSKTPNSAVKLARSVRSAVGVAAFQRSGAGKHGGSSRATHRRARQSVRRALRRGDW